MRNIYNTLKKIGDIVSNYFSRVDDNFDRIITTDVTGAVAAVLVVLAFIPVLVIVFVIALLISFININNDDEASNSKSRG